MYQKILITLLVAAVLSLTYFSGRSAGYSAGEKATTEVYQKQVEEYKTALNNQTTVLNQALNIKAVDLSKEVSSLLKDTQQIRIALKNQPQPLVLIKEGDCRASDQLLESRRKIIERANK